MASVNFPSTLGGDDSTVSDDANTSTTLALGGHRTRFIPALSQFIAVCSFVIAAARDTAYKTGSTIDGTNWSAAEHASGSAVTTGSAKNWASLTGAAVTTGNYSAQEWAVGTSIRASRGSAKDWAILAGAGLPSSEYSSKEYAIGTSIRGSIGSAKDWAIYTGSPDGTNKSAKSYAADAAASASTAVNAPGTSGTSTTSLTVGTGNQTFTTQTGKSWAVGQFVVVARSSAVNNFMVGQISAYNSGTGSMTVAVSTINGSGTYTDWTIALTSSNSATVTGASTATANTYALRDANADIAFRYATVDRILSASTTAYLFDATVTTLNFGGAVTSMAMLPNVTTLDICSAATGTRTGNFFQAATVNGATLTLNFGTNGASGSTTNVGIGSVNGGTTTINSPTTNIGNPGGGTVSLNSRTQNIGESGQGITALKSATTDIQGRARIAAHYCDHVAKGSISGAQSLDLATSNSFSATITGATTLSFTNAPASGKSCSFVFEATNGGSAAITWPGSVKWPAGLAPVLTSSGVDVLVFYTRDGGSTWRAMVSQKGSA